MRRCHHSCRRGLRPYLFFAGAEVAAALASARVTLGYLNGEIRGFVRGDSHRYGCCGNTDGNERFLENRNPAEIRVDMNQQALRAMIFIGRPSGPAIRSADRLGSTPCIIRQGMPVSRESQSLAFHHELLINPEFLGVLEGFITLRRRAAVLLR